MNQKWRILLGICLVVMVCVPIVTASIQLPTIENSFTQSLSDRLNFIGSTQYARENIRMPQGLPDFQMPSPSENIRKPDFSAMPDFSGESVTISGILKDLRNWRSSPPSQVYITKEEAFDIALTRFPGIELVEPLTATLKRATKPCWKVTVTGYDPAEWTKDIHMYEGGIVFIDAVTGEILDVYILM